jgi:redox-sensitive bicupin YhaK (pirin superfamily)
VYVYRGSGVVNGQAVKEHAVVHVDAESPDVRLLRLEAEKGKLGAMIFAGKRLNQPIAWHGPFVATTQDEIRKLLKDYQNGNFPPVRAPWNYRSIADFPKNKE